MQRGTVFRGTVFNLNAGGNDKDSAACLVLSDCLLTITI